MQLLKTVNTSRRKENSRVVQWAMPGLTEGRIITDAAPSPKWKPRVVEDGDGCCLETPFMLGS